MELTPALFIEAMNRAVTTGALDLTGGCRQTVAAMVEAFPGLTPVWGWVECEKHAQWPHWYLRDAAGNVVDPTAAQFERVGAYGEWPDDGQGPVFGRCVNCLALLREDRRLCRACNVDLWEQRTRELAAAPPLGLPRLAPADGEGRVAYSDEGARAAMTEQTISEKEPLLAENADLRQALKQAEEHAAMHARAVETLHEALVRVQRICDGEEVRPGYRLAAIEEEVEEALAGNRS